MSTVSALEKTSGFFFFAGFIFSKAQYLPIPLIPGPLLGAIAIVCQIQGYSIWFISSHLYPDNNAKKNSWYGFASFKKQLMAAATLGLIGTAFSLATLFIPILLLPTSWIFLLSNLLWFVAEYHKFNNPPLNDETYTQSFQKTYLSYLKVIIGITAIVAVSNTIAFFFPLLSYPLFIATAISTYCLGILGLKLWIKATFGTHKDIPATPQNIPVPIQPSHIQMTQSLGASVIPKANSNPAEPDYQVYFLSPQPQAAATPPGNAAATNNDLICSL